MDHPLHAHFRLLVCTRMFECVKKCSHSFDFATIHICICNANSLPDREGQTWSRHSGLENPAVLSVLFSHDDDLFHFYGALHFDAYLFSYAISTISDWF